jgi:Glyoxalase-like domain
MMVRMIDHLVFASNDLPATSAAIAELVGTMPTPGGHHVGHGTYNELLSLGGATYLEVIGPDPEQPVPDGPRPFGIDSLSRPALVAWCVRPTRPLAEIIDEARAAGIELGDVAAMSRRRPDGVLLEWRLTFPQLTGRFGMALPFMIDWADSSHPTDTLPSAVQLIGLDVAHPDARALRTAFGIIGITTGVDLREEPQPALRARIATRAGEITLTS